MSIMDLAFTYVKGFFSVDDTTLGSGSGSNDNQGIIADPTAHYDVETGQAGTSAYDEGGTSKPSVKKKKRPSNRKSPTTSNFKSLAGTIKSTWSGEDQRNLLSKSSSASSSFSSTMIGLPSQRYPSDTSSTSDSHPSSSSSANDDAPTNNIASTATKWGDNTKWNRRSGQSRRGRSARRQSSHLKRLDDDDDDVIVDDDDDDVIVDDGQETHLRFCSHGTVWTTIGVSVAWAGVALAVLARESTKFVQLDDPMYIDPVYNEVSGVGMIHLQLCYNETHVGMTGCSIQSISSDDIDDTMFQTARSFASLALMFGGFMTIFLTLAVCWQSINLRPVGLGYLLAYFMQSFTFLFFDANLCSQHGCSIGTGGIYSVFASVCWIIACIAASRMDAFKFQRRMERRARSRSRSRSASPQKLQPRVHSLSPQKTLPINEKKLERRVTDATAYGSDSSLRSLDAGDHNHQTMTKKQFRVFASNGCEVIQGIQDTQAVDAWLKRSSRKGQRDSTLTTRKDRPSKKKTKKKETKLSILLDDDDDFHDDSLRNAKSSGTSISSSPIVQTTPRAALLGPSERTSPRSTKTNGAALRTDHTGDIRRGRTTKRPSTPTSATKRALSTGSRIESETVIREQVRKEGRAASVERHKFTVVNARQTKETRLSDLPVSPSIKAKYGTSARKVSSDRLPRGRSSKSKKMDEPKIRRPQEPAGNVVTGGRQRSLSQGRETKPKHVRRGSDKPKNHREIDEIDDLFLPGTKQRSASQRT